jgi:group I intron endonuclease
MTGIYKITNPKGKVYIGQSVNIKNRILSYKTGHCKGQGGIYNSIKKHGWGSHSFEVVKVCDVDSLNFWERNYQDYYNSVNDGLNCRAVKSEDKSGYLSNETKKKISLSKKGIKQS